VSQISGDDSFFTANVSDADDLTLVPAAVQPTQDYQPGQYVACITETDYEQEDVKVTYMHPCGPAM